MLRIVGRRILSRRLGSGISHCVSPSLATASATNTNMNWMYHNSPSIAGSFGSRAFHCGSDTFTSLSLVSSFRVQSALVCMRSFSTGSSNFPVISDPDVKAAFKELMAWGWDDIPDSVISDAKKAIAKSTEDKVGQKALSDVFRAAEASEEFSAILVNIRMGLEERTGLTGEDVTELPEELANAITVAYNRYIAYVNSFGPDETYLRKKVEAELGTRLIHMKQRVSGLGSEWGDINVIGTSGLSGSYVEQRSL